MKKRLVALLAAVMVLTLGTTAFAANSPISAAQAVTDVKGVEGVAVAGLVEETFEEAVAEAAKVDAKAEVIAAVEITVPDGTKFPATLTFAVEGVKAGDKIVILHEKADGTWEQITPDKVEDGKVTATFTSLSPVAIVKIPAGQSPDTGVVSVLPIVAVACVAGIAGCAKKDNE